MRPLHYCLLSPSCKIRPLFIFLRQLLLVPESLRNSAKLITPPPCQMDPTTLTITFLFVG